MTKDLKMPFASLAGRSAPVAILLVGILLAPQAPVRANWPGFRGPTGLGYTTEENLPLTWGGPDRKNVTSLAIARIFIAIDHRKPSD